jgi:ribulose-phosphate 3-epimerase
MIEYVLDLCGIVLIMTVNPGFGGQQFLPEMLPKISALRRLCDERGLDTVIEVDGGLGSENAWRVLDAGANAIVAGSHVFHAPDYAQAISSIRKSTPPPPAPPGHSRESGNPETAASWEPVSGPPLSRG